VKIIIGNSIFIFSFLVFQNKIIFFYAFQAIALKFQEKLKRNHTFL
jgi:hypothetical protein